MSLDKKANIARKRAEAEAAKPKPELQPAFPWPPRNMPARFFDIPAAS